MRATMLYAATAAGLLAMSALAQAQDMQMAPAQGGAMQQNAQGASADSSYGGAMSTSKASGTSRDAWTPGTSQVCVAGLSCNIYTGS